MSDSFTLGPPLDGDLPRLAVLSRDQVEYGFAWSYTGPTLLRARDRSDHELVVARNDTEVLGGALMQLHEDYAHLKLLVVDVPHRRRGVANALMNWVEVIARTAGVFDVTLEVRVSNVGAQAFYRQRGYRPLVRIPRFYRGLEDAVYMRADLRVRA